MKVKRLLVLMLIALSIGFVSCKKDGASTTADGGSNPINPTNCDDPEGTITANLRNDSGYITVLNGTLKMNTADNFEFNSQPHHERTFVNIGEVDGLGCVENIPQSGWSNQVAVIPGNGYVVKDKYDHPYYPDDKYTIYARIYVTRYILSANYEILGAELKYQDEWKSLLNVTTTSITNITATSATCGGNVTDDDGSAVTARGVCWSTSQNPTVIDACTVDGSGIGAYTTTLTGLRVNTVYYVRAYARNSVGISYGEELSLKTEIPTPPVGAINGVFAISDTEQVFFSHGNLQYQASTNTWRLAGNQWDYIGNDNANISSNYSGWIDLFGWGTSGYNHGAVCYQPWGTSETSSDYYAYGNSAYNLNDQTGQADWGYNAITNGGNTTNTWRTLTRDEWVYVFNTRSTSSGIRYAKATVNGVNGVILLPDNWSSSNYSLSNTNSSGASYSSNRISQSDWTNRLEANGAVFLPAAGCRYGTDVNGVGSGGLYWSASCYFSLYARNVWFLDDGLDPGGWVGRENGRSVRVVCSAE